MDPVLIALLGGTVTFALLSVALVAVARAQPSARLSELSGGRQDGRRSTMVNVGSDLRPDLFPRLSDRLAETRFWQDLQLLVLRAGLLLRPSEALVAGAAAGLAAMAIGWLLTVNWAWTLLAGALGIAAAYTYLKVLASRRQSQLMNQLPHALDMLASGLRSGHALTRSLRIVESQCGRPMSEEVGHVLQDIRVGVSTSEALRLFVSRTDSYDIELVVAAIQIHLKLGGNLAEVLDNISEVIRERVRLKGEIDAATSEGRLSASILIAMPFAMALFISVMNPGYLTPLVQEPAGRAMLLGAAIMMLIGIIIIRKLIEIDF